jgi:hypothetical protein
LNEETWADNIKMGLKEIGCERWTGFMWLGIGSLKVKRLKMYNGLEQT